MNYSTSNSDYLVAWEASFKIASPDQFLCTKPMRILNINLHLDSI